MQALNLTTWPYTQVNVSDFSLLKSVFKEKKKSNAIHVEPVSQSIGTTVTLARTAVIACVSLLDTLAS